MKRAKAKGVRIGGRLAGPASPLAPPDQIISGPEDRNRFGRLLCSANCHATANKKDIDLGFDQLRRILRNQTTM
jgi:hypothetical protein